MIDVIQNNMVPPEEGGRMEIHMNAEKLMSAIGHISDEHIQEYAFVRPVGGASVSDRLLSRRKWFFRLCACAAVIALYFVITSSGTNELFPLIKVTAYAMDGRGSVIENEMAFNTRYPVSSFELDDGTKGYLFSVEQEEANGIPSIVVIYAGDWDFLGRAYRRDGSYDMTRLKEMDLAQNKTYFLLVGSSDSDFKNVAFLYSTARTTLKIKMSVTEIEGDYYAQLRTVDVFSKEN